jgi:pyruvate kinase
MHKILCTLGPKSLNATTIETMDGLGVDIFRINLSHTPLEKLEEVIRLVQGSTAKVICLDSEGAQLRTHVMRKNPLTLKTGALVKIHNEPVLGDEENLTITPFGIAEQFNVGDVLNLDSNLVSLRVVEKCVGGVYGVVISGGEIGTCKAVDINRFMDLPAITPKDREAFAMGRAYGLSTYALSFSDSAKSVGQVRDIVGPGATVISKIESRQGLRNLESIIDASEGILIDRGDLSRQVPLEMIPFCQAGIIARANRKNVDVYVATNFIESMMRNPMPSKSELNDLVSTILMGANGIVLAAETAVGAYPVNCVRMVANLLRICRQWSVDDSFEMLLGE